MFIRGAQIATACRSLPTAFVTAAARCIQETAARRPVFARRPTATTHTTRTTRITHTTLTNRIATNRIATIRINVRAQAISSASTASATPYAPICVLLPFAISVLTAVMFDPVLHRHSGVASLRGSSQLEAAAPTSSSNMQELLYAANCHRRLCCLHSHPPRELAQMVFPYLSGATRTAAVRSMTTSSTSALVSAR